MVLGLLNLIKTFKNCIDAHVSRSISLFIIDALSDRTSSLTADRFKDYLDEQVQLLPINKVKMTYNRIKWILNPPLSAPKF